MSSCGLRERASGSASASSGSSSSVVRGTIRIPGSGAGRFTAGAVAADVHSMDGSCWRIAFSSCCSEGWDRCRAPRRVPGGPPVGLESLGLPACPVEREHELTARSFPQRVVADERFELADELRVPAQARSASTRSSTRPGGAPPAGRSHSPRTARTQVGRAGPRHRARASRARGRSSGSPPGKRPCPPRGAARSDADRADPPRREQVARAARDQELAAVGPGTLRSCET